MCQRHVFQRLTHWTARLQILARLPSPRVTMHDTLMKANHVKEYPRVVPTPMCHRGAKKLAEFHHKAQAQGQSKRPISICEPNHCNCKPNQLISHHEI